MVSDPPLSTNSRLGFTSFEEVAIGILNFRKGQSLLRTLTVCLAKTKNKEPSDTLVFKAKGCSYLMTKRWTRKIHGVMNFHTMLTRSNIKPV